MTTNGRDLSGSFETLIALAQQTHKLYQEERAAPTPVAGPELSEEQVRVDWSRSYFTAGRRSGEWPDLFTDERDLVMDFARRIFARGIASAQAPSLLEARREGWDAARDWTTPETGTLGHTPVFNEANTSRRAQFDAERDARFPLPAPAGITLDGGRIWYDERQSSRGPWFVSDDGGAVKLDGTMLGALAALGVIVPDHIVPSILALAKAYAAAQSEAR